MLNDVFSKGKIRNSQLRSNLGKKIQTNPFCHQEAAMHLFHVNNNIALFKIKCNYYFLNKASKQNI